jgi:glycosyltransferase involved in cell wall biosynthesis
MRILVLLSYYNRPLLVRKALESILQANEHHTDWFLVFGDDFSLVPGKPILADVLQNHEKQYKYINSYSNIENKIRNGLQIGRYANLAIGDSDADIVVMLCDDDRLEPTYLRDLSKFYTDNPDVMYAYSKVKLYNPLIADEPSSNGGKYDFEGSINPVNNLDASQISFRTEAFRQGVRFPNSTKTDAGPFMKNLDGELFRQLFERYGPAVPTNIVGQWKGIHDFQLVWNKKKSSEDFVKYVDMVARWGGERF